MRYFQLLLPCFFLAVVVFNPAISQKSLLQSGPMLGYTDMLESMIWAQTNAPAKMQIAYWESGTQGEKKYTSAAYTTKKEGYTARLVADEVVPGKTYQYQLFINDEAVSFDYPTTFQTQTLWQWRTDPPPFKVALGSCAYVNETEYDRPGKPYGDGYNIFRSIHAQRPDAMVWLGDNVYLREVDWFTRTGFIHRYTHARSLPELQPLLASTHHYAIWDDHDYGPNDSDGSYIHKGMAKEVFQLFWGNPTYGLPGKEGITTAFQFADMDFFLLDNRTFRNPNRRTTGEQTLLGHDQMEWLIGALAASYAPFKLVCIGGQVLNPKKSHETYANLCPEERNYLLGRIQEEGIKNVVFLTGDVHHSELNELVLPDGSVVYDFTVSPLTSGVHAPDVESPLMVPGTLVSERNFGMLEFSGSRTERKMTMRIFNSDGKEMWSKEIASKK